MTTTNRISERYPAAGNPHSPAAFLADIGASAERNKTAFRWQGADIPYGELLQQVEDLSGQLRRHFEECDLVAAWLPNCPEIIRLCLAVFRNGMTAMPLNAETSKPELIAICQRARVHTLVTNATLAAALSESDLAAAGINDLLVLEGNIISCWVSRSAESSVRAIDSRRAAALGQSALVIHTSGSSGFPKGVVLSQRALQHIIQGRINSARIKPESSAIVASCLSHSVGLYQALAFLQAGASFTLLESYETGQLAETLVRQKPSHLIMVVSAFQDLLLHSGVTIDSLSQLEFASVGADRVPAELQARYHELTGKVLAVSYGMTELSWILLNDLQDPDYSVALGRPTPGVEIRLLDPEGHEVADGHLGEIVARSPKAMSGYLGADGSVPDDCGPQWIHSGDLASRDAEGIYWFGGRIKDLIVLSSGDVVSPAEIEQAALQMNGIDDCIALGVSVSQSRLGNLATEPWLVITSTSRELSVSEIMDHLRNLLSQHKQPTRIVFHSSLPKGITGKVSRPQLARYLRRRNGE